MKTWIFESIIIVPVAAERNRWQRAIGRLINGEFPFVAVGNAPTIAQHFLNSSAPDLKYSRQAHHGFRVCRSGIQSVNDLLNFFFSSEPSDTTEPDIRSIVIEAISLPSPCTCVGWTTLTWTPSAPALRSNAGSLGPMFASPSCRWTTFWYNSTYLS